MHYFFSTKFFGSALKVIDFSNMYTNFHLTHLRMHVCVINSYPTSMVENGTWKWSLVENINLVSGSASRLMHSIRLVT